ncbi:MAG: type II toxin-antitoxin system RelE/ParE family toxin [Thauera sp.]
MTLTAPAAPARRRRLTTPDLCGFWQPATALEVLVQNPLIGRLVANAKRELVIGRRSHGYVALYRDVPEIDTVFVLAIRSQREAGYAERDSAG